MSSLLLPILSPPGLGILAIPNLESSGPTIIIDPLMLFPSVLNFSELKDFKLISSALKLYLFGLIFFTLTPIDERRFISLLTSIISGILLITTSSDVKSVAHII